MTRWQPDGDFYLYLDSLVPRETAQPSFRWSGLLDGARQLAAQQMVDWIADQNLRQADIFAHSHGGRGKPRHPTRTPDRPSRPAELAGARRVVPRLCERTADHRYPLRLDLVIIADRGGQNSPTPEHVASDLARQRVFEHGDTHQPRTGTVRPRACLSRTLGFRGGHRSIGQASRIRRHLASDGDRGRGHALLNAVTPAARPSERSPECCWSRRRPVFPCDRAVWRQSTRDSSTCWPVSTPPMRGQRWSGSRRHPCRRWRRSQRRGRAGAANARPNPRQDGDRP